MVEESEIRFLLNTMRIYQNEPLVSKSTPNVVHQLHDTDNTYDVANNSTDDNNNGGVASNGVKLRKRVKRLSPLSNRHSWSEYRLRDDHDYVVTTDKHQRKNSLVKRSWTGSELKLSDIKEVTFEDKKHNLIYNRRNAISVTQLNQITPEKKSDKSWMGGIRRKISVTVSIFRGESETLEISEMYLF